eukprot:3524642-Rhodomonas_salina.1
MPGGVRSWGKLAGCGDGGRGVGDVDGGAELRRCGWDGVHFGERSEQWAGGADGEGGGRWDGVVQCCVGVRRHVV